MNANASQPARHEDVERLLKPDNDELTAKILDLHPTVADLERAAVYLVRGDALTADLQAPLDGVPAQICALMQQAEDWDEER